MPSISLQVTLLKCCRLTGNESQETAPTQTLVSLLLKMGRKKETELVEKLGEEMMMNATLGGEDGAGLCRHAQRWVPARRSGTSWWQTGISLPLLSAESHLQWCISWPSKIIIVSKRRSLLCTPHLPPCFTIDFQLTGQPSSQASSISVTLVPWLCSGPGSEYIN